ncbi:MAG: FAD-dependent oxidoreductase [Burkholderiales bacterium]
MTLPIKEPVLVLGGGLAAVSFVGTLRSQGWSGQICVVTEEDEAPYDRPPLSKEFQRDGDEEKIRLDLRMAKDVEWIRNARAVSLDLQGRQVTLADGRQLSWGTLVFATGASPRTLPALASGPAPVLTLRTLADARQIRDRLVPGAALTVVGGGVIGLELAATARAKGTNVTLVEATPRVLNRCAPSTLAELVELTHRTHGVDLRLDCTISSFDGEQLRLSDGSTLRTDLVVVGIGVLANDTLAREAGIAADDGIFVDGHGRTTCPDVLAIGDVTRQRNPVSGRFERIETWSNANKQSATAARALIDPSTPPYAEVPWYWTDQYDLKIQVAGLAGGNQEVIRGDLNSGKASIVQLRDGRIVGASCINNAREFMALKRLIAAGGRPDLDRLRDPAVDAGKLGAPA